MTNPYSVAFVALVIPACVTASASAQSERLTGAEIRVHFTDKTVFVPLHPRHCGRPEQSKRLYPTP